MYINFEELREFIVENQSAENPGIFIEYMGLCHEPEDIYIDDDGDVIICI